ncbi:hypothetical protein GYMLUDRAFT_249618 [Collybiopsis luxurians FD-317 M1]|uniref:Uncharacterized protein n=1 Tax=Collybiopsis luxurians FD-317 M1 TaxID=944289 RepID=A0A0D0BHM7_9AGAR|nr:hypothetical protein GYMLUDRAFT_249618 [Collybiopsis luxurians FD-317 M1]
MFTISTALRNFKEPTKEQITQNFFSLPSVPAGKDVGGVEKLNINGVLSLDAAREEDANTSLDRLARAPYLVFSSLDKKLFALRFIYQSYRFGLDFILDLGRWSVL